MSPFHVWWFFLWHPHMLQSPSRSCIRTLVRLTFRLRDKLFFSPLRLQGHLCLLILIIYRCFPVNIIRWLRGWSFFCTRYFHSDAVILYRSPDIGHHSSVISPITDHRSESVMSYRHRIGFFGTIFFSEQCLTLITDHMDSTICRSLTGNVTGHIMTGPFTGLQLPVIDRSGSVTTYQLPVFHCVFIGQFLVSRVSSTLHSCIPLAMIVLNTIFYGFNNLHDFLCFSILMFYWRRLPNHAISVICTSISTGYMQTTGLADRSAEGWIVLTAFTCRLQTLQSVSRNSWVTLMTLARLARRHFVWTSAFLLLLRQCIFSSYWNQQEFWYIGLPIRLTA